MAANHGVLRGNLMGHIDPTKEVFAQFRANDRPGPIHMLNLVRLRAQAAYPDGRKATGAEPDAAYGRGRAPGFDRRGGRTVWQGRFEVRLIGPDAQRGAPSATAAPLSSRIRPNISQRSPLNFIICRCLLTR